MWTNLYTLHQPLYNLPKFGLVSEGEVVEVGVLALICQDCQVLYYLYTRATCSLEENLIKIERSNLFKKS